MADPGAPRRRALKVSMGALCLEAGFSTAESAALETLTEMTQSFITEIGRSARAFSELSGRTLPMISDVAVALVEMGFDIQSLPTYVKSSKNVLFMPPTVAHPTPQPRTLQVGQKKSHPSHIPDHLPSFPDPHSYIRTPSHKQPCSEYQVVREKAASQKRDVERALTRFIAKTGETESLFQDDPYAFPLIANKPKSLAYLDALLPKEDESDKSEETQKQEQQTAAVSEAEVAKRTASQDRETKAQGTVAPSSGGGPQQDPSTPKQSPDGAGGAQQTPGGTSNADGNDSETFIDNPYLRPIIMPKLKGGAKKYKW